MCLTARTMPDFSKCNPLRISEPQRGLQLSFEDPVFAHKLPITQKELLVHCPSDVGQHALPIHKLPYRQLELISQL
jgi:hypothetical protein